MKFGYTVLNKAEAILSTAANLTNNANEQITSKIQLKLKKVVKSGTSLLREKFELIMLKEC